MPTISGSLFRAGDAQIILTTLPEYPFAQGSSLNAAGINYNSLQAFQAMKRLKELETLTPPVN
jgi:hypothetical protein